MTTVTPTPTPKYIGSVIYRAVRIGGISILTAWSAHKFFKIKDIDLGKFDMKDITKLILVVGAASTIDDFAVSKGIYPGDLPM